MASYTNYFHARSPPILLDEEAAVSELIDDETKWWNTPLLGTLFIAEEAKVILSIPINCTNQEDTLI